MFTGIVEGVGVVDRLEQQHDAARLTVRAPHLLTDLRLGDSVAVSGCCLTVAAREDDAFTADVMHETLATTSLGSLGVGDRVNLELAATPTSRLGGHLVQGHVDGTGAVVARERSERWDLLTVSLPEELSRYVVTKGSIAVDGVSLTVVSTSSTSRGSALAVSLIPETLARTTLGHKQLGDAVNLEVDVIAKYVERLLSTGSTSRDREG